jgi:beta-phosphoglucomutase-like phosphatase (HAD superfamily)
MEVISAAEDRLRPHWLAQRDSGLASPQTGPHSGARHGSGCANRFQMGFAVVGSPQMLTAAVEHAGIASLLDAVISVEEAGILKPHRSVYRLAGKHLGLPSNAMSFQSSNAWDAYAAKSCGLRVIWVNRFGQARECLPGEPDAEIGDLGVVPDLLEPL